MRVCGVYLLTLGCPGPGTGNRNTRPSDFVGAPVLTTGLPTIAYRLSVDSRYAVHQLPTLQPDALTLAKQPFLIFSKRKPRGSRLIALGVSVAHSQAVGQPFFALSNRVVSPPRVEGAGWSVGMLTVCR